MLKFFKGFTEWSLGVINSLFRQNIAMDTFLNIFLIVVVVAVAILIIAYINLNKKYKKLRKDIRRNNIQVVREYRRGKYKDVIRTKDYLRNPKKNKKVTGTDGSYSSAKNVTNIVED